MLFCLDEIHDDKTGLNIGKNFNANHIGSFLPNCGSFSVTRPNFCPSWSYSSTNSITASSVNDALLSTLGNYYWSCYNNHWFGHLFTSPAFAMILRDFGDDISFNFLTLSDSFKRIKKYEYKRSFYDSDYRLGSAVGSDYPSKDLVNDYFALLRLLEQSPDYWNDIAKDKVIQGPLTLGSFINQFVYSPNRKQELLEEFSAVIEKRKTLHNVKSS